MSTLDLGQCCCPLLAAQEIYVQGVAANFPKAGSNLRTWWDLLLSNADLTMQIPESRFSSAHWNLPCRAGLLEDPYAFDAAEFGVTKAEAQSMDPQQFLLLETAQQGCEDAGAPLSKMSNTATAVFVGAMNQDYQEMVHVSEVGPHFAAGAARSSLAARVSYVFDFRGECMITDSACSSGLVATHNGVNALSRSSSATTTALCCGVNLALNVLVWVSLQKANMISDRCRSFCADANGYGRGEGCGVLVLQATGPSALAHAQVVGSHVNSDGHSASPITKPSAESQKDCMRCAWGQLLGLCQLVEAHGTGTPVGDPVEGESLASVFRGSSDKVHVGAVKANTNHLESAAAMAGVIKVLLCMKRGALPPFGGGQWSEATSSFDFSSEGLAVPSEVQTQWQPMGCDFHAGVNSFGFGGQNAHLGLRKAVCGGGALPARAASLPSFPFRPVVICSAGSFKGLEASLRKAKAEAELTEAEAVEEFVLNMGVAWTLRESGGASQRRKFRGWCVLGRDPSVRTAPSLSGAAAPQPVPVVFTFSGNGNLRAGMMRDACAVPVVRAKLEEIDRLMGVIVPRLKDEAILDPAYELDVLQWCSSGDALPEEPGKSQVLLFACQVAQVAMWASLGVEPAVVLAHSAGEVAAAVASGALTLEAGLKVALVRGGLQNRVCGGAMMSVLAGQEQLKALQVTERTSAEMACFNTPESTTLSGSKEHLQAAEELLQCANVGVHLLKSVPAAYHSSHMEGILYDVVCALADLRCPETPRQCQVVSSVTGAQINKEELLRGSYWAKSIRQPVRFLEAAQAAQHCAGRCIFLEIGPGKLVSSMIQQILPSHDDRTVLHTQSKEAELADAASEACAALWACGHDIKWAAFYGERASIREQSAWIMPSRAFNHSTSYWLEPPINCSLRRDGPSAAPSMARAMQHPYLAMAPAGATGSARLYSVRITESQCPVVYDHRWGQNHKVLVPGAFWAECALSAFVDRAPTLDGRQVHLDIIFEQMCFVEDGERDMRVHMWDDGDFIIKDATSGDYFASGMAAHRAEAHVPPVTLRDVEAHTANCDRREPEEFFSLLQRAQLHYGPLLRGLQSWKWNEDLKEGLLKLELSPLLQEELNSCVASPALLDMFLQGLALLLAEGKHGALPIDISMTVNRRARLSRKFTAFVHFGTVVHGVVPFWGGICSESGEMVIEVQEASAQLLQRGTNSPVEQHVWNDLWKLAIRKLPSLPRVEALQQGVALFCHCECLLARAVLQVMERSNVRVEVCTSIQGLATALANKTGLFLWGPPTPAAACEDVYREMLEQLESFCTVVRKADGQGVSHPFWVVTHNTPLVREDLRGSAAVVQDASVLDPGGSLCWGAIKNMINEEVMQGPSGSRLRVLELSTLSKENLDVLAWEVLGEPRGDCAELIVKDGSPHRLEVVSEDWSWREMCESTAVSVHLEKCCASSCEFRIHNDLPLAVLTTNGQFPANGKGCARGHGGERCVGGSHTRREGGGGACSGSATCSGDATCGGGIARASGANGGGGDACRDACCDELLVDVTHIVLEGKSSHQPMHHDSHLVMREFRAELPHDGPGRGEELVCCCPPRKMAFGRQTVRRQLTMPASELPDRALSLLQLVMAREIMDRVKQHMPLATTLRLATKQLSCAEAVGHGLGLALRTLSPVVLPGSDLIQGETGSCHVLITHESEFRAWEQQGLRTLCRGGILVVVSHNPSHSLLSNLTQSDLDRLRELSIELETIWTALLFQNARLLRSVPEVRGLLQSVGLEQRSKWPCTDTKADLAAMWNENRFHGLLARGTALAPLHRPVCQLRQDAAYVVVGALRGRGLGLLTAGWLSTHGARHLVLCGRSDPDPDLLEAIQPEVDVKLVKVDVCKSSELKHEFELLPVPIAGVFHGAAVFADGLFMRQGLEHVNAVLQPKVLGTLALAEVLEKTPSLETFVLQSSVVSVMGNWGQVAYGAGNNFQDSFALKRRLQGKVCTSINWTSLELGVLAGKDDMVNHLLQTRGFESLSRDAIKNALEAVMMLGQPQVAVARFDWDVVEKSVMMGNPLVRGRFHSLCEKFARSQSTQGAAPGAGLSEEEVQQQMVLALQDVLQLGCSEDLLHDKLSLPDLGMTSGDAIEARQRLKEKLGLTINLRAFLAHDLSVSEFIQQHTSACLSTHHTHQHD